MISYNEITNVLYLIELKRCEAKKNAKKDMEKESREPLIRAIFEIQTYYSFFENIRANKDHWKYLKSEIELQAKKYNLDSLNLEKVQIKKAVLGPRRLYEEKKTSISELANLETDIDFFSIEIINETITDKKLSERENIFKITKQNV